jgi:hemerythrin-like domain-containing protein
VSDRSINHMITTDERPWIGEMTVVHRVFRRESRNLARLVRVVRPGDTARAALLGAWLRDYHEGLHNHHTGEDELLWPLLLARVDLEADLVLRMEQQHETVAAGLHTIMELLPHWERAADAHTRDALAAALDRHAHDLTIHLDEEERSVMPLVLEHITVAEWDRLGEHGRAQMPKDKQFLMLSALLEEATPQETARFLALVPAPVRILWRLVGRSAYNRRMRRIRQG